MQVVPHENELNLAQIVQTNAKADCELNLMGNQEIRLEWRKLKYKITRRVWKTGSEFPFIRVENDEKTILENQNGKLEFAKLMGVLGPSGAGKSTLLECLAGRRTLNLQGNIYLSCNGQSERQPLAFISQKDNLMDMLTVRETLLFASKLKNRENKSKTKLEFQGYTECRVDHNLVVQNVLEELNLVQCADNLIKRCSGGQLKRLSFALELISKPQILILDEPTSGLDSSSAYQCIAALKNLTTSNNQRTIPLSIIASIHQPSASLFNLFDNLYILSHRGECIYHGPTSQLLNHLSTFNLNCPKFHNPSDYLIEIASGDLGKDNLNELKYHEQNKWANEKSNNEHDTYKIDITTFLAKMLKQPFPLFFHIWILLQRTWTYTLRDPVSSWIKLIDYIGMALFMSYMHDNQIGKPDGCFSDLLNTIMTNSSSSKSTLIERFEENMLDQQSTTSANAALIFFTLLFLGLVNTMCTLLSFPLEMNVIVEERGNSWYSPASYYIAKMIADIPFQFMFPLIFASILYPITGQFPSIWRFLLYSTICVLVASISQSLGVLIGILYLDNPSGALIMAPILVGPLLLTGGFIVDIRNVFWLMKPFAHLSYIRYAFEAIIIILYGFNRCSTTVLPKEVNSATFMAELLCPAIKASNVSDGNKLVASFFHVEESCINNVMDIMEDMVISIPDDQVRLIEAINDQKPSSSSSSYMMSHWELEDNYLGFNISILILILFCVHLISVFTLFYKIDKKIKK